jgi:hypothetical protein
VRAEEKLFFRLVGFLNFQVLALPEIGNSAAKAAAHADFVGLSMYRNAQLSVQTGDWIERWPG